MTLSTPPRRLSSPIVAVVAFALMVLAGIWGIAFWLITSNRTDIHRTARAELLGAQSVLAAQMGRTVESAETLLHAVDIWLSARADVPSAGELAELARHVDRLQLRHELPVNVRLFDAAGDMIPFGRFTEAGINIADREYVQALAGRPPGSVHTGLPIVTRNNTTRAIPIAMKAAPNPLGIAIILTAIPVQPLMQTFETLLVTAPGSDELSPR